MVVDRFFALLVRILLVVFFVFAWPISKLMDRFLGEDRVTAYRRSELKVCGQHVGEQMHRPFSVVLLASHDWHRYEMVSPSPVVLLFFYTIFVNVGINITARAAGAWA